MLKHIQSDLIQATKNKDEVKKETLRLIVSEIKNEKIKLKKDLTDSDIIKILKRGLKSRKESINLFKQGNRTDLIEKTEKEIDVITAYLPKQLSQEDIEKIVSSTIEELDAKDIKDTGKVMKAIMSKYSSQINGKTVQQLVSSKLSKPE